MKPATSTTCPACGYGLENGKCPSVDCNDDQQLEREAGEVVAGDLPVVASHTALLDVLDAAKRLLAMNNCNYDREAMRSSGGFEHLERVVRRVEALRQ